jgi:hypothetical protein
MHVLLVMRALAYFSRHYELAPEEFDFKSVMTYLSGLGIGLLATAALSLSPTLADVPDTGAEVVRIAFRLGVLVDEVSQNLEPRELTNSTQDTWATVVTGVTVDETQAVLDAIQSREVRDSPDVQLEY